MSTEPVVTPSETPAATDPPSLLSTPSTPEAPSAQTPPTETPPVETPPAPEPLAWDAIKIPEGFTVEDADRDAFLGVMNDDKLTPTERGQKLIDLQTSLMTKAAEANYKAWTDLQETWQNEVRADPEIGGDKLEPALGEISKLLDRYGSPELRQAMTETGAGNHPQVVRFLHKIAKDLGEGGPVLGAPAETKGSLADRLYPSMKKQGA